LFQNLFNRYSRAEITDEEDKVIILKVFKKAVRSYKPEEKKWWSNNYPWAENLGIQRFFNMVTPRLIDGYKLKKD
jgi:hypothetical protein